MNHRVTSATHATAGWHGRASRWYSSTTMMTHQNTRQHSSGGSTHAGGRTSSTMPVHLSSALCTATFDGRRCSHFVSFCRTDDDLGQYLVHICTTVDQLLLTLRSCSFFLHDCWQHTWGVVVYRLLRIMIFITPTLFHCLEYCTSCGNFKSFVF